MENASKALLMAGGILIAIIIISMLLLMITKIGDYQRTKDSGAKSTQIAKFNSDFERYIDDKGIKGTDIISLINKVQDYNSKRLENSEETTSGATNYVDYNIPMSITIRGLDEFNEKYANDSGNKLFNVKKNEALIFNNTTKAGNKLMNEMNEFIEAEQKATIPTLKKISSFYTKGINKDDIVSKLKDLGEDTIAEEVNNGTIEMDTIIKYTQYSEFKTSTFVIDEEPTYADNGQIQSLSFKFEK